MKKIIISLILLFCLTGCWNYKELNDYSIISGIAIDKYDDEYEVSILISNSSKTSSSETSSKPNVVVYTGRGDSIVAATKDIGLISPKELYFGSFSIVVLSEEIAKDGISEPLDFFLRYSNMGKNFYIVIAKDCKAKDTLKVMTPLTNFPSQNISDNLSSTTKLQGIIAKTNFNDILSIVLRNGVNPVINTIEIKGSVKDGEKKENLEHSEPEAYTKLGTIAIFKGDKLVDFTNHKESLGINIINNRIDEMYLKVENNDGYIIADTTYFKSSRTSTLKNDKPIMNLNFKVEARIIEVNGKFDLENPKEISYLESKACKEIKKFANKAIKKSIENKTDIFGFGLDFYREYPNYFNKVKKEWDNNLEDIKVNMKCNITFKNKMTAKNSLEEIYDKEKIN